MILAIHAAEYDDECEITHKSSVELLYPKITIFV
jgi:hypothetical protein